MTIETAGTNPEISAEKAKGILTEWMSNVQDSAARVDTQAPYSTDESVVEARARLARSETSIQEGMGRIENVTAQERANILRSVLRSLNIDNSLLGVLKIDVQKIAKKSFGDS